MRTNVQGKRFPIKGLALTTAVRRTHFTNSIHSHRLSSIQRAETCREGFLIKMMHQTVKLLEWVPRGQPSYPLQLCVRRSIGLCCTHDVSPPRLVSPRGLPSTTITWLQRCRVGGGALTCWPPSAAQTGRAVFPHPAFTKMRFRRRLSEGIR